MKSAFLRFTHHVEAFLQTMRLFPPSGRAVVAVSGGVDSMLLLFTLHLIARRRPQKISQLTILHMNHHTRGEANQREAELVATFCTQLGRTLTLKECHLPLTAPNFEARARTLRQAAFTQELKSGDRLYLGHHLDDSFEWSLMQQFKSSKEKSSLGIPVINGPLARPFLCVTRAQIEAMAKLIQLPFAEDASNRDPHHERNALRTQTIPWIAQRYPSYLKNYVQQATQRAQHWNCLRSQMAQPAHAPRLIHLSTPTTQTFIDPTLTGEGFVHATERLQTAIESLSTAQRGKLRDQIQKLILMARSPGTSGPLSFSGGTQAFTLQGVISLMGPKATADSSAQLTCTQFRTQLFTLIAQDRIAFPFLITSNDPHLMRLMPSLRRAPQPTVPLPPNIKWFRSAIDLLRLWSRPIHRDKKFIIQFLSLKQDQD